MELTWDKIERSWREKGKKEAILTMLDSTRRGNKKKEVVNHKLFSEMYNVFFYNFPIKLGYISSSCMSGHCSCINPKEFPVFPSSWHPGSPAAINYPHKRSSTGTRHFLWGETANCIHKNVK